MKTFELSNRASALSPSPTLSITAKANEMKAQGIDVIPFAAGEPDFNTPEPICEAAIEAIRAGFTKYTPSSGIAPLKEAIAEKLWNENRVKVKPSQVVVSCGAKQSIYELCQVLLNPGDEAILIAPYWMTYAEQIRLAGATPAVVHTSSADGFVPAVGAIAEAITPRTRAIIMNSPCNPTGALFPTDIVKGIAELAVKNDLWLISDEIYERLVYGGEVLSPASLGDAFAERTITVGGVSKTYAMTGWRIGFAAAPEPVAKALSNLQDQITSNPTSFAQKGAVAAYQLPADSVEAMRAEFQARRDLILSELRQIPGVVANTPGGAFYAFSDFSAYCKGRFKSDVELAAYLLDDAHVAVVPGSVFEGPGHLRLTYATSREKIEAGVKRIGASLARLGS